MIIVIAQSLEALGQISDLQRVEIFVLATSVQIWLFPILSISLVIALLAFITRRNYIYSAGLTFVSIISPLFIPLSYFKWGRLIFAFLVDSLAWIYGYVLSIFTFPSYLLTAKWKRGSLTNMQRTLAVVSLTILVSMALYVYMRSWPGIKMAAKSLIEIQNKKPGISKEEYQRRAEKLGVTTAVVNRSFRTMANHKIPDEQVEYQLVGIISLYKELQKDLQKSFSGDTYVDGLRLKAAKALNTGDLWAAERFLEEASTIDTGAIIAESRRRLDEEPQKHRKSTERHLISLATTKGQLGLLKLSEMAYAEAAKYYHQALELLPEKKSQEPMLAKYLAMRGLAAYKSGDLVNGQRALERALAIFTKLPSEHSLMTEVLGYLAIIYRSQGNHDKAESLFRRALKIQEVIPNLQNLQAAEMFEKIGHSTFYHGKYAEAELLYRRALGIRERFQGHKYLNLATTLLYLAQLYNYQGLYSEAKTVGYHVRAILDEYHGSKEAKVVQVLYILAHAQIRLGLYSEAESLAQQALALSEKTLRPEDVELAWSLHSLALSYVGQGRYRETEPLAQRALVSLKKALGQENRYVAYGLLLLGNIYLHQGQYDKAGRLVEEALLIMVQSLSSQHPDIAAGLYILAKVYLGLGLYEESASFAQRALAIQEKSLGTAHPYIANTLNLLASLHYEQARYDAGELQAQRAVVIWEATLGQWHPNLPQFLNTLGLLKHQQGRYSEAEQLLKRALAIQKKMLSKEHPDIATSQNNLALLYRKQGRFTEAQKLYETSLKILEKAHGMDHPHIVETLGHIAVSYCEEDRYFEAESLFQRALEISKRLLPPNHHKLAALLESCASLLRKIGREREASKMQERANSIRSKQKEANVDNRVQRFLNRILFPKNRDILRIVVEGKKVSSNNP